MPVWGQAYSPNVGWINLYCQNGNYKPEGVSSGATSINSNDSCVAEGQNYGILFDTVTGQFKNGTGTTITSTDSSIVTLNGFGYSKNYGWLLMSGATAPINGGNLSGDTNYAGGNTYFTKNNPNNYNSGISYNVADGTLNGVAYNDQIGWIFFNCINGRSTGIAGPDVCDTAPYNNYNVYLDTRAPVVNANLFTPSSGSTLIATTTQGVAINGVSDIGSAGIKDYQLKIDNANICGGTITLPSATTFQTSTGFIINISDVDDCGSDGSRVYHLTLYARDKVGNIGSESFTYTVIAADPDLSGGAGAYLQNQDPYKFIPQAVAGSTNYSKINVIPTRMINNIPTEIPDNNIVADGSDYYVLKIVLRDANNNEYRTVPHPSYPLDPTKNIRNVEVKTNVNNNVDLNQFAKGTNDEYNYDTKIPNGNQDKGDGVLYASQELINKAQVGNANNLGVDELILNENNDAINIDGNYQLNIRSYTPTTNVYNKTTKNNNASLKNIVISSKTKMCLSCQSSEKINTIDSNNSIISGPKILSFKSALEATIAVVGNNTIQEGVEKEFNITLKNNSTKPLSNITLRTLFEGPNSANPCSIPLYSFSERQIIKRGNDSLTTTSTNGTTTPSDISEDYEVNGVSSPSSKSFITDNDIPNNNKVITAINGGENILYTIKATPGISETFLALGCKAETASFSVSTQLGYAIEGGLQPSRYYGDIFGRNNPTDDPTKVSGYGDVAQVVTSEISIAGQTRSDKLKTITANNDINQIGTISVDQLRTIMHKNASELTRNAPPPSNNGTTNIIKNNFTFAGAYGTELKKEAGLNQGRILYFRDPAGTNEFDVVLEDGGSVTIPGPVSRTIIIKGGNLYIKNNITYGDGGSLGVIVLKDPITQAGGNVYIDPAVTSVVGAFYAEGSVLSAKDANSNNLIEENEIYDGFNTREGDLANQLYWNGSIVSRNTVGGRQIREKITIDGSERTIASLPLNFKEVKTSNQLSNFNNKLKWPVELNTNNNPTSNYINADLNMQKNTAQRYDLSYLRRFALNSSGAILNSGIRATQADNAPLYIEYSSLVQTKTPLGFETTIEKETEEVVR